LLLKNARFRQYIFQLEPLQLLWSSQTLKNGDATLVTLQYCPPFTFVPSANVHAYVLPGLKAELLHAAKTWGNCLNRAKQNLASEYNQHHQQVS